MIYADLPPPQPLAVEQSVAPVKQLSSWQGLQHAIFITQKLYDPYEKEYALILEDLTKRTSSEAFLLDSQAYMDQWKIDRGLTLEWRMPEDASRNIIQAVLRDVEWKGISDAKQIVQEHYPQHGDQVIQEIYRRTSSEQFRENPEEYLANWQLNRGWTKEFRMPEDAAFHTITQVIQILNNPTTLPDFTLEELRLEAYKYSRNDSEAQQIVQLIQLHMQTPSFQHNPGRYIQVWEKLRGHTEEWRFPEDPARRILQALFLD